MLLQVFGILFPVFYGYICILYNITQINERSNKKKPVVKMKNHSYTP